MMLYAEIFIALIRYFNNYLTLHRSDLATWAAPLDPRLDSTSLTCQREDVKRVEEAIWLALNKLKFIERFYTIG